MKVKVEDKLTRVEMDSLKGTFDFVDILLSFANKYVIKSGCPE